MHLQSHSEDWSTSTSGSLGAIPFKALDALGVPKFIDVTVSRSTSESETESISAMSSLSLPLDFNYFVAEIPATNVNTCLEINPLPMSASPFKKHPRALLRGIYICSHQRSVVLRESYAHLFERCRETAGVDCNSSLTQTINLALRGDREISALIYSLRSSLVPGTEVNPAIAFSKIANADALFAAIPKVNTMLVISPLAFSAEKAMPSFAKKYAELAPR